MITEQFMEKNELVFNYVAYEQDLAEAKSKQDAKEVARLSEVLETRKCTEDNHVTVYVLKADDEEDEEDEEEKEEKELEAGDATDVENQPPANQPQELSHKRQKTGAAQVIDLRRSLKHSG